MSRSFVLTAAFLVALGLPARAGDAIKILGVNPRTCFAPCSIELRIRIERNDRNDRNPEREPRSLDDQRQRRLDDARLDQSTDVEGILAGKYSALIPQPKPEPEPWRSPLAANRESR